MDIAKYLLPDRNLELLSPALWSSLIIQDRSDSYDKMAWAYDLLVGNSLYNRVVWGTWAKTYSDAADREIIQAARGPIIDIGCGSLIFTAKPYLSAPLTRMILFDRSLGMMKRGQARLPRGQFVQGDAFNSPFQDGVFETVLAWGFLHVVGSRSPLLSEMCRIAESGANISLSTLVLSERRIGNKMLQLLHDKGEAAPPETAENVINAFKRHFLLTDKIQKGSMLFLRGKVCD